MNSKETLDYIKIFSTLNNTLEDNMRQTGRTSKIIENLQPNDLVFVHDSRMIPYYKERLSEIGKEPDSYIILNYFGNRDYIRGMRFKNIYYDNALVYTLVRNVINGLEKDILYYETIKLINV